MKLNADRPCPWDYLPKPPDYRHTAVRVQTDGQTDGQMVRLTDRRYQVHYLPAPHYFEVDENINMYKEAKRIKWNIYFLDLVDLELTYFWWCFKVVPFLTNGACNLSKKVWPWKVTQIRSNEDHTKLKKKYWINKLGPLYSYFCKQLHSEFYPCLHVYLNRPDMTLLTYKLPNDNPRVVSNIFTYSYSDYLDQRTFWTSLNVTQCYIQRGSESSLVKKIRIWIWISVAYNPGA